FQAEDGIRGDKVTGVQTCALPTCLRLHPRRESSPASQSRSSGCVGSEPILPKSLAVSISPRPKWCCHNRLTITRLVRGLSGLVRSEERRVGKEGSSGGWRCADTTW